MYVIEFNGKVLLTAEQASELVKFLDKTVSVEGWSEEQYKLKKTSRFTINDASEDLLLDLKQADMLDYNTVGEYRYARDNPTPEGN